MQFLKVAFRFRKAKWALKGVHTKLSLQAGIPVDGEATGVGKMRS